MVNFERTLDTIWVSIVSYSMVQGYLLFILFPSFQKGSNHAKWLLAVISLICAILLTEEFLSHVIGYENLPHLIFSVSPLWYLLGPVIYFYIRHHTAHKKVRLLDFWHILPFFWVLFSSLEFYSFSGETKLHYLQMSKEGSVHPTHNFNFFLFSIQSFYYLITSALLVKSTRGSSRKKPENRWITQLVVGLAFIASMSFLSVVVLNIKINNLAWVGSSYFFIVSAFLLTLFVHSLRSPKVLYFVGQSPGTKSLNTHVEWQEAYNELLRFLSKEKPYQDPEFDLQALSKTLGHSKHFVSQLIKEYTGLGFRDFINKCRLEEAKEKLASTRSKQYTIESIAIDAGFTSLATFYRAFKKMEGKPPKSFIG